MRERKSIGFGVGSGAGREGEIWDVVESVGVDVRGRKCIDWNVDSRKNSKGIESLRQ